MKLVCWKRNKVSTSNVVTIKRDIRLFYLKTLGAYFVCLLQLIVSNQSLIHVIIWQVL